MTNNMLTSSGNSSIDNAVKKNTFDVIDDADYYIEESVSLLISLISDKDSFFNASICVHVTRTLSVLLDYISGGKLLPCESLEVSIYKKDDNPKDPDWIVDISNIIKISSIEDISYFSAMMRCDQELQDYRDLSIDSNKVPFIFKIGEHYERLF